MAEIEDLFIRGIRSFSPYAVDFENAKIHFWKPLTLIVGQNGCGKTTIIECLQVACTGSLPPGSDRGGYFIHDPNLTGKSDVRGQIRLRFKDTQGRRLELERSFQGKATAKRVTMNARDTRLGTQQANNYKEFTDVQTRPPGAMNQEMPKLLGVSRPILEHVVFVHQEDSLWPLGDSTDVKKRFDEIFSATRYTKALEALRKLLKEKNTKMNLDKKTLELYGAHKDQATRARDSIRTNTEKVDLLNAKMQKLEGEVRALADEKAAISKQYEVIGRLKQKIKLKAVEHEQKLHLNEELLKSMDQKPLDESDEEIAEYVKNLDAQMDTVAAELNGLQRVIEEQRKEKVIVGEQIEAARKEQLEHLSLKKTHDKTVQDRAAFIARMAQEHQIPGFENVDDIQAPKVLKFVDALNDIVAKRQEDQDKRAKDHGQELASLNKLVDQASSELNKIQEKIKVNESSLASATGEMRQKEQQLASLSTSRTRLDTLAGKLKSAEEDLARFNDDQKANEIDDQIKDINAQLRLIGPQLSDLRKTATELTALEGKRARVEIATTNRTAKKTELDAIMAREAPRIAKLSVTGPVQPESLEAIVRAERQGLQDTAKEHENAATTLSKSLASQEGVIKKLRSDLKQAQHEVKTLERQLNNAVPALKESGRTISEELKAVQAKKDAATVELTQLTSLGDFYGAVLKQAEASKSCPTCCRAFGTDDEFAQFQAQMKSDIEQAPAKRIEIKAHMATLNKQLTALRKYEPEAHRLTSIKTNLVPQLTADLEEKEKEIADVRESVNTASAKLKATQKQLEELSQLLRSAEKVDALVNEIAELDRNLHRDALDLKETSSDQTLESVNREIEDISRKQDNLNRDLEDKRRRKMAQMKEKHRLESLISEHSADKTKLEHELSKVSDLEAQLESSSAACDLLQEEIRTMKLEVSPLQKDLDTRLRTKLAFDEQAQTEMETFRRRVFDAQQNVTTLNQLHTSVTSYSRGGHEAQLERILKTISDKQEQAKSVETKIEEARKSMDEKNNLLNARRQLEEQLKKNVAYRAAVKSSNAVGAELDVLKADLAKQPSNSTQCQEEIDRLESDIQAKQAQRSSYHGRRQAYKDAILQSRAELGKRELASADKNYNKMMVEVDTTEMALRDIERYALALDKAVVEHHQQRMADLNAIISDLWTETYQGRDIDTIRIKAEKGDGTRRASYNYSVVMVKGQTELDMKGRCSAGQKVLAALVVRLALAETFCVGCGVLALDEPTTNLDQYNIKALAQALSRLVAKREGQKNFQLIIITHDEDFVEWMRHSKQCSYYWSVQKDESGYSTIQRRDINLLA